MSFIQLNQLQKTFLQNGNDEQVVLNQLNLTINKGDFITILGSNGAGKSTLLNCISGELSLTSGTIMMDNIHLETLSEHQRSHYISRVFQNPSYGTAPRMSIEQNLSLAMNRGKSRTLKKAISKNNQKYFKSLLQQLELGLEHRLSTEIGVLSGGQRQAVSLIMATMNIPQLLLLDEHTAALDPKMQRKIMELTKNVVTKNNITTLMITHNISDALTYGNRMIILHQGKVVYDFNSEEKSQLTTNDVFSLLEALN